ncbi:MAG: transketolase C-terminal domain-containing protein [Thermomicrobium sp.]|nr:transketolase C-terminal domain-containing protein [Thermomicrobium sp.]
MNVGTRAGLRMGKATRDAFGEALRELGHQFPDLVVVDGDVSNSTRTEYFAQAFPDRFFNVGIAESNLVGVAAGLAASGKRVVAASFACFLLCNAFDQIRMSVAFPRSNVKLVGSHAGISIGEDGPSQMGIEDVALALALPGVAVLVPADEHATRAATRAMLEWKGPTYLRLGRPPVPVVYEPNIEFVIGRAFRVRDGHDIAVIANGLMVAVALDAAEELAARGISARVLDMATVRPLDVDAVVAAARETRGIVVAEEHLHYGGLGSVVAMTVAQHRPCPMAFVDLDDTYAESGAPEDLLRAYGLTSERIVASALELLERA